MFILGKPEFKRIELDEVKLWKRLGYSNPAKVDGSTKRIFNNIVGLGQRLIQPEACYKISGIESINSQSEKDTIELKNGIEFISDDLAELLSGSRQLATFLTTIGPQVEEKVEELSKAGELTSAYILDTFGSEILVGLTYKLKYLIKKYAQETEGYGITHWYCPGYGDWDVQEQRKIFNLLDARRIGVELNKFCMMRPRKSYSGVIGMGPNVIDNGETWRYKGFEPF